MKKFTAGPWTFEEHSGEEYGLRENCSFAIKGPPLCEDLPGIQLATIVSDCVDEHEANARLIAAAPELLEALKNLEHWASCQPIDDLLDFVNRHPIAHARKAIAKALTPNN